MPVKSFRKRVKQAEATRVTLLSAARKLFARRGYPEVSIDEIVQAARVTKGALYHHFKDKRELFRGVVEQIEQEIRERLREAAAGPKEARAQLQAACGAYLDACAEDAFGRIVIQPRVVLRADTGSAVPPAPEPMAFAHNLQPPAAEGADYEAVDNDLPIIVPQPVHRPTYSQVYKSIPFIRSEYMANRSYRHEATMEIMFGKLRPMSINRYYYGRTPLYRDGFRYGRTYSSARPPYPRNYFYYPRPTLYRNY